MGCIVSRMCLFGAALGCVGQFSDIGPSAIIDASPIDNLGGLRGIPQSSDSEKGPETRPFSESPPITFCNAPSLPATVL